MNGLEDWSIIVAGHGERPRVTRHQNYRVVLAYKNFAASKNISHIGLGVSALNTAKTLTKHGIMAEVWPITSGNELRQKLNMAKHDHHKVTHVVISAPWIPTHGLNQLTLMFPSIHFVMNSHSNVGFLQADPNGMRLIREGLELEMGAPNFSVSANCKKLKHWIEDAYAHPCQYLPNLYYLGGHVGRHHRPHFSGGVLKIGCFGAVRPQKNLASSVAAAIEIHHQMRVDTEIWTSSGRSEGGGDTVMRTVREMVKNVPGVTLRESGWCSWPQFRKIVGSMHLLMQPSYTESFNMVTADGIAEGVPTVVSEAIDWVPKYWSANADDVFEMARVGHGLIINHRAAEDGMIALEKYVSEGTEAWQKFLHQTLKPHHFGSVHG